MNSEKESIEYCYKLLRDELTNIYQQIKIRYDHKSNNYILPAAEFDEYLNRLWCIPYQLDNIFDRVEAYEHKTANSYIDMLTLLTERLK